ncbi:T3SS (YopN, CesT) and YbjN peptide-binding chaperone 1 [Nonomuraea sp. SYSU D8015]|uniref:T3SS (YopN, CesT) and YbjN peptide-binding chaperone 1 n=1 Tax=Nonomuraea sp. SYSU D8015 TaxID=2593644 RepID=UPI001660C3E2|nr:YbjN domain-containing protein [Nonomuraea sp. SYSU D8015]
MPNDAPLRTRIHRLISGYLDGQPLTTDISTEPVAIRSGTAVVYVRLIEATPPVVRVFSPLLRGIDQSQGLLEELNELNGRLSFLRLFWRDGTVFAASELLAETLTGAELANSCDWLAEAADYYDVRLRSRFGGETAFAERRPT